MAFVITQQDAVWPGNQAVLLLHVLSQGIALKAEADLYANGLAAPPAMSTKMSSKRKVFSKVSSALYTFALTSPGSVGFNRCIKLVHVVAMLEYSSHSPF
jgi:hypothetical protein